MREKIEAFFDWLESQEGEEFLLFCETGKASSSYIANVCKPFGIDPMSILLQCFHLYLDKVRNIR